MTTKIHLLVDALGNPVEVMLTPGQAHDLSCAEPLIDAADPQALIADKAYDADALIDTLNQREIIPVMEATGSQEEEAARVLGAGGFQTFFRVTLPNIKWGLLYGVILCNARAMGEFGAVSVVSGHIRGLTNTLPLHVEILYNEYQFQAAFAVASILAFLALVTLVLKTLVEYRTRQVLASIHEGPRAAVSST